MAKRNDLAHTASNDVLSCARPQIARPYRRKTMRPRFQFGLAALLTIAALVLTARSFAQQPSSQSTPSATPPAASTPAPATPPAASTPADTPAQTPPESTTGPVGTTND